MLNEAQFEERITRVERPASYYTLIRATDGKFLGVSGQTLDTFDQADNTVIWDIVDGGNAYKHVVTGLIVEAKRADANDGYYLHHNGNLLADDGSAANEGATFSPEHGPADLPSTYLETFKQNGWVALPCILSPDTVEALERATCTGRWENEIYAPINPPLTETAAVAKAAAEPVSLWLIRQYMGMQDINLAHSPSFAILPKDDGVRDVQGWHSDYPYLWGIASKTDGNRIPTHQVDELVLGVQRNLCISEFRKENGATCFKFGSHRLGEGPPEAWGTGNIYRERGYRAAHGLPYHGPEADVIEAPGGSYLIYDSRLWHRGGVNRTEYKRAALLQAVVPMYIMPFIDTSRPYNDFINSPLFDTLTKLEQRELEAIMVHKIIGPDGTFAMGIDETLSEVMQGKRVYGE